MFTYHLSLIPVRTDLADAANETQARGDPSTSCGPLKVLFLCSLQARNGLPNPERKWVLRDDGCQLFM